MKRRDFLATTAAATAAFAAPAAAKEDDRHFFELIHYELVNRSKMKKLEQYWGKAAIPALTRMGIEPVGVLRSKYGSHGLDLYALIPHKTMESFTSVWDKLAADKQYLKDGADYLQADVSDPLYYRYETSLLQAFSHMPMLEVPAHIKGKNSRVFEVRIYESYSREKGKLKMEMFNEGGEIALFRKTGLHPVMFAETLAGEKMPNLTYILGFENMVEHDKNWDVFRKSDGWAKMKVNPRYKNTVSSVTDIILRPSSVSQM